ncbi:MAG: TCR/Tet family MFS transporter [Pseudomonadota bacterium]
MSDAKVGRSPALIFILITLVINSMGIGLIMPVMPDLLLEVTGKNDLAYVAVIGGFLTTSFAVMQFVFSPTLGNLSDRFGRRSVLLISLGVLCFDYLAMALTGSLTVLFIARIVAGMAASTYSTANAYIADVSPPEKRAQNFGLTGAAFGVGFILGPALGGILGEFGPRMPFFAAAALTFANFLFGYFVLPESLKEENRRPFDWKRANPLGVAAQIAKVPAVAWFLFAILLYDIAHFVYPAVWSYFAAEAWGWGPSDIGYSLAFVGIGFAIVQGYLIRKIIPRFGEAKTALMGLGLTMATLSLISIATEGYWFYAIAPFAALSAIVAPAMQGLMANRIADDAQGELQGAIAAMSSLAFIISPFLMTSLFAAFSGDGAPFYFPGAPFLAAAIFSGLAIIPFLIGARRGKN